MCLNAVTKLLRSGLESWKTPVTQMLTTFIKNYHHEWTKCQFSLVSDLVVENYYGASKSLSIASQDAFIVLVDCAPREAPHELFSFIRPPQAPISTANIPTGCKPSVFPNISVTEIDHGKTSMLIRFASVLSLNIEEFSLLDEVVHSVEDASDNENSFKESLDNVVYFQYIIYNVCLFVLAMENSQESSITPVTPGCSLEIEEVGVCPIRKTNVENSTDMDVKKSNDFIRIHNNVVEMGESDKSRSDQNEDDAEDNGDAETEDHQSVEGVKDSETDYEISDVSNSDDGSGD